MIDNGKYTAVYNSLEELEEVLQTPGVTFDREEVSRHTGERFYHFYFRNLALRVNPRLCQIGVRGSLTTLIKGNNYSNLTFSEVQEAVQIVLRVLKKAPGDVTVNRFEFAVCVETPLPPVEYLDLLKSYKLKPFYALHPPYGQTKPLERLCSLQQFTVKFYDTGRWNHLQRGNLLKYEINFRKSEKARQIWGLRRGEGITMETFQNLAFISALEQFAIKTYQTIDKEPSLLKCNSTLLKPTERRLLFAGCNPKYWELEKLTAQKTYKDTRKDYLRLKAILNWNSPITDDLGKLIMAKFAILTNPLASAYSGVAAAGTGSESNLPGVNLK